MNEDTISPDEKIKRLTNFGFEKIGHWEISDKKNRISYNIDDSKEEIIKNRGIYAFVAFGCSKTDSSEYNYPNPKIPRPDFSKPIKYIGINETTKGTLEKRFDRYSNNKRNENRAKQIIDLIERYNCSVEIFTFNPSSQKMDIKEEYKKVQIDFVKGFENGLIAYLDTDWNKRR